MFDIVPSPILLSNTDIELKMAKDHREVRLQKNWMRLNKTMTFPLSTVPGRSRG